MLEVKIGQTLDGYRIIFNGKECAETKDGRNTTLGDYSIEKEDTIVVGKMTSKNINPSVRDIGEGGVGCVRKDGLDGRDGIRWGWIIGRVVG